MNTQKTASELLFEQMEKVQEEARKTVEQLNVRSELTAIGVLNCTVESLGLSHLSSVQNQLVEQAKAQAEMYRNVTAGITEGIAAQMMRLHEQLSPLKLQMAQMEEAMRPFHNALSLDVGRWTIPEH